MISESSGLLTRLRRAPAARNFGWLSADRGLRLATSLVLGVWMARVLGPADYGRLNFALSLIALIVVVPALGLDSILRRELVRRPEASDALLGTAFLLRLGCGIAAYAIMAAATLMSNPHTVPTECLLILGCLFAQPALQTADMWFHSRLDARALVLVPNVGFFIAMIARAIVLWLQPDLVWIVLTLILELPLAAILTLMVYRQRGQRVATWRFDPSVARAFLKEAWPLMFSSMAILVYHRIDQVMLPTMAGPAEAGQYAAAVKVVELWYFVPMALAASWAPTLVRAHGAGPGEFDSTIQRQFGRQAAVAWLVGGLTAVAAPWLLPLLFGDAYASAGQIAALLVLSLPFVALGVARGEVWVVSGQTRLSLAAAVAGAVTNVLLNLWWIPLWGAIGATWATIVSYGVAAIGATFCLPAGRAIGTWQLNALALRGFVWNRRATPE